MLKCEEANVTLIYKSGNQYPVSPRYHQAILDAWTGRESFVDVDGLYGERVTVRLADVCAITYWTEAQMAELIEQNELEKLRG